MAVTMTEDQIAQFAAKNTAPRSLPMQTWNALPASWRKTLVCRTQGTIYLAKLDGENGTWTRVELTRSKPQLTSIHGEPHTFGA